MIVSVIGGSRVQIAGPTGAFVVILASITAQHGIDGLQIATLLAGVILLVFGYRAPGCDHQVHSRSGDCRIHRRHRRHHLDGTVEGLSSACPRCPGEHFHEKLWHSLQVFPQLHVATTALATLALIVVIVTPRLPGLKRVPGRSSDWS